MTDVNITGYGFKCHKCGEFDHRADQHECRSPEKIFMDFLDKLSLTNPEIVEAFKYSQKQAFNSGVMSERHQTKTTPKWITDAYFEEGRKRGVEGMHCHL